MMSGDVGAGDTTQLPTELLWAARRPSPSHQVSAQGKGQHQPRPSSPSSGGEGSSLFLAGQCLILNSWLQL